MQEEPLTAADFSEGLFWDIDPATLDITRHVRYVVSRVLEAGTLEDWRRLCRHFTLSGVVEVARGLRALDPKSLGFLSAVAQVPQEAFRCCTSKPLTSTHWIY